MARRGIFLVPTLSAGHVMLEGDTSAVPAWIVDKLRETQDAAVKSLRARAKAGVPIAMGSDAATPLNYHGENGLELASHAAGRPQTDGMPRRRHLQRRAGARSRGDIGSIKEGKFADLLVVDATRLMTSSVSATGRSSVRSSWTEAGCPPTCRFHIPRQYSSKTA